MHARTESASAAAWTIVTAAASAALIVAAAAVGGATPVTIALLAASSFLLVAGWAAHEIVRAQRDARASRHRVDGIVAALRAVLDGNDESGPVETGDPSLDQVVSVVLDQQHLAAEAAIDIDRRIRDWTGCVQRLAEGDLARDVSFGSDDELGSALAVLQGRQREFAEAARRIADGDLNVHIEAWSERDLLGFALAGMVDGLRSTVGELRKAASNIESSSRSMTGVSSEVSRGMEEVAMQTGQLAAGAESQVQVLEATRSDAQTATTSASEALRLTGAGVASVERADGTMADLAQASHEVRDAIHSLSSRSARIVDFVGMITTIADQTNLLALNAAIEAARAGEHGRGFAVVADEVRKLAEESQSSAAQISVLVGEIQEETDRTVEVVERTASQAEIGTAVVGEARAAFEDIRGAVDDASQRVAGILTSLAEVSNVATAASLSTEAVSAATEQTSASMQELDASAAETARMSEVLSEVAARFQLDDRAAADAVVDAAYAA